MHPERPERIEAILRGIVETGLDLIEIESPEINRSELALVHDPAYVEMIEMFCALGGGSLDMDTIASRDTWMAALTSAGGVRAVVEILEGMTDATGFVVARPPGHHALRQRAMGFCIFNNVAVVAAWLRANGKRVAILDWDVHHGNGTQALVGPDPGILYVSVHQSSFYPFGGHLEDIDLDAKGTTVNVPLPAGTAGDVYRSSWEELVLPIVTQFSPDWVLVSAGYDGHTEDPLADFDLLDSDYGWMASRLAQVHSPSRTVFALEGGYDLDALRHSARSTLLGMAGENQFGPPLQSAEGAATALDDGRRAIARHWRL
ncbi:MAG: histone deacetylase [Actinomycetota bacterium]|nr:histone deacetylase [Actinomycetota bacterium]